MMKNSKSVKNLVEMAGHDSVDFVDAIRALRDANPNDNELAHFATVVGIEDMTTE